MPILDGKPREVGRLAEGRPNIGGKAIIEKFRSTWVIGVVLEWTLSTLPIRLAHGLTGQ